MHNIAPKTLIEIFFEKGIIYMHYCIEAMGGDAQPKSGGWAPGKIKCEGNQNYGDRMQQIAAGKFLAS